ncbi:hypothetical protein Dip510_000850 [Elusimicrobium posterum]|uniref:hypothetical protein n=1 Tax=Elusimicrobium posterum TaxID=3116653 RepID=UPI003C74245B
MNGKIVIKKSATADTRSAAGLVAKEVLLASSMQHIEDVKKAMEYFCRRLQSKAECHDWTKVDYINAFHEDFEKTQKTGCDFRTLEWFKIHITKERHHLNDRCPEDVDLFDVLERVADICMAGMGRSGKVYDDTLSPEILQRAYRNTVKLLCSEIIVEE